MSQYFQIHPDNPQPRLIAQAVAIIRNGGVVVYPTDATYALACHIGFKEPLERICHLRRLNAQHDFTLVCRDLSEVGLYARLDNQAFRLLKAATPGAYTFILPATSETPRRLQNPKRKTIGVRIPKHNIALALVSALGEPLMSTTLQMPGEEYPLTDPEEFRERLEKHVDLIIAGGVGGLEPTSVIDLSQGGIVVKRQGKGDVTKFMV